MDLATGTGESVMREAATAFRRWRDTHTASGRQHVRLFEERFGAASERLTSPSAEVRTAGVHALAALADEWEAGQQRCVDALCAYLRRPYDPPPEPQAADGKPAGEAEHGAGEVAPARAEQRVRRSVIALVAAHLRPGAPRSWRGRAFDFKGVVFDGGDFSGAVFDGETTVTFEGARFVAGTVSFADARFASRRVSFSSSCFDGAEVVFDGARFENHWNPKARMHDGGVNFCRCVFRKGRISYNAAEFTGGHASFDSAVFAGAEVSFDRARFTGGTVQFDHADFFRGKVTHTGARFAGSRVSYRSVQINDAPLLSYSGAEFAAGTVEFVGARFRRGQASFDKARFTGAEVSFHAAAFTGTALDFHDAEFTSGLVDFRGAEIRSGSLDFRHARFTDGPADVSREPRNTRPVFDDWSVRPRQVLLPRRRKGAA